MRAIVMSLLLLVGLLAAPPTLRAQSKAGEDVAVTDKEVWVYLDVSATVMDKDQDQSQRPSAQLAEMLRILVEPGRFLTKGNTVRLATFGAEVGNRTELVVGNAAKADDVARLLSDYRDARLPAATTTVFSTLLSGIASDLEQAVDKPRLILIASDFVPDPSNSPCGFRELWTGEDQGATARALTGARGHMEALRASLGRLPVSARTKSQTVFAFFGVSPRRPNWRNEASVQCFMDSLREVEGDRGVIGMLRSELQGKALYYPYAQFSGGRDMNEFVRGFEAAILSLLEGPKLKPPVTARRDGRFAVSAAVEGKSGANFEIISAALSVPGGEIDAAVRETEPGLRYDIAASLEEARAADAALTLSVQWRWVGEGGPGRRLETVIQGPTRLVLAAPGLRGVAFANGLYTVTLGLAAEEAALGQIESVVLSGAESDVEKTPTLVDGGLEVKLDRLEAERVFDGDTFSAALRLSGETERRERSAFKTPDRVVTWSRNSDRVSQSYLSDERAVQVTLKIKTDDDQPGRVWRRVSQASLVPAADRLIAGDEVVTADEPKVLHPGEEKTVIFNVPIEKVLEARTLQRGSSESSIKLRLEGETGTFEVPIDPLWVPDAKVLDLSMPEAGSIQVSLDQVQGGDRPVVSVFGPTGRKFGDVPAAACEDLPGKGAATGAEVRCKLSDGLLAEIGKQTTFYVQGGDKDELERERARSLLLTSTGISMSMRRREQPADPSDKFIVVVDGALLDDRSRSFGGGARAPLKLGFQFVRMQQDASGVEAPDPDTLLVGVPAGLPVWYRADADGRGQFNRSHDGEGEYGDKLSLVLRVPQSADGNGTASTPIPWAAWKHYQLRVVDAAEVSDPRAQSLSRAEKVCDSAIWVPCNELTDFMRMNSNLGFNLLALVVAGLSAVAIFRYRLMRFRVFPNISLPGFWLIYKYFRLGDYLYAVAGAGVLFSGAAFADIGWNWLSALILLLAILLPALTAYGRVMDD